MKQRVFIATKGAVALSVLTTFPSNPQEKLTAVKSDRTPNADIVAKLGLTNNGDINTVVTLNTLTSCIKELDVKSLTNVCDIYVTSNVAKVINNGWHKFWLLTGKDSKGTDVNEHLLKAYTEFEKAYAKKAMYIRVLEIGNCKPRGNQTPAQLKNLSFDQKLNYNYATRLWSLVSPVQEIPDFSDAEQTA